jgi:WD40 repeat protein
LTGRFTPNFEIAFNPTHSTFVVPNSTNRLYIRDIINGHIVATLVGHEKAATAAIFTPDGAQLISGSFDGAIRIWDTTTGAQVKVLTGHKSPVWCLDVSGDGKKLVSGSGRSQGGFRPEEPNRDDDNTVRLWDLSSGKQIAILQHERQGE